MTTPVTVRPVQPADRPQWDDLFQAYASFYKVTQTPQMRNRVWSWLHDPIRQAKGIVALADDGMLIGLAHYRHLDQPLTATIGGFLDDLFVTPAARGSGAAQALIQQLCEIGKVQGWADISWITAEDNYRGRAVYDRLASKTRWVTYEIPL